MPAIIKKDRRIKLQLVANKDHSLSGGLIAFEAMTQQFGFWQKLWPNRGGIAAGATAPKSSSGKFFARSVRATRGGRCRGRIIRYFQVLRSRAEP